MTHDERTRSAYESNASTYSDDWLAQPVPTDMYSLLKKYFVRGSVVDIGCGNGRDAGWLSQQGFSVSAYDSSLAMIEIARAQFGGVFFGVSELPNLTEIHSQFDNVLCETVIMHLPREILGSSIERLKSLMKPGGRMYLSWRVTEGADARHADGRLYSAFDPVRVTSHFTERDVLHFEDRMSDSSGKRVCRLIVKRS